MNIKVYLQASQRSIYLLFLSVNDMNAFLLGKFYSDNNAKNIDVEKIVNQIQSLLLGYFDTHHDEVKYIWGITSKKDKSQFIELVVKEVIFQLEQKAEQMEKIFIGVSDVTVEVYISDEEVELFDSESLTNACGEFMEALGFEMKAEEEPIFNSFLKRIKFVFKKHGTPEELDEALKNGKRALELKYVKLPTAEETDKLASAAQKMEKTLDKYQEGAIRLGNLLVLKVFNNGQSTIYIEQLNFEMVQRFERERSLIKNIRLICHLLFDENGQGQSSTNEIIPVIDAPSTE